MSPQPSLLGFVSLEICRNGQEKNYRGTKACQEDAYLLELVRYIHLNPLRAGLVKTIDDLDSYPWCGHGVLMGKQELSGQLVDNVLQMFGQRKKSARQAYREFVIDGIKQGHRNDLVGGGLRRSQGIRTSGGHDVYDDRILGSGEFVESLWRETESDEIVVPKISIDDMMQRAAGMLGVTEELLLQRTRVKELVDARAAICYLAVRECNFSGVAVGRALHMTRSGVSVAVRRGGEIVRSNPVFREKLID